MLYYNHIKSNLQPVEMVQYGIMIILILYDFVNIIYYSVNYTNLINVTKKDLPVKWRYTSKYYQYSHTPFLLLESTEII
jgi:hypothetical protein